VQQPAEQRREAERLHRRASCRPDEQSSERDHQQREADHAELVEVLEVERVSVLHDHGRRPIALPAQRECARSLAA
jgi:hypothetical protein